MACPKADKLFEWISIPSEVPRFSRVRLCLHLRFCKPCKTRCAQIEENWQNCLVPEPDVTASIMRVYASLKRDETLILKGWKLGENRRSGGNAWLFPSAVALGALALAVWVSAPSTLLSFTKSPKAMKDDSPLAQIRYEDKNRVQVHYVKPELLQSIEFETASAE
ncbi:MAG: hypothetical protein HYR96_08580 [Deltaproteobacteria bacterium]|nr:hypothetical protein [Deltaproteobacteria bacterium]MBI3294667.1 hypothetical protein [Deltaproteobacteria bacterium]